ncbi:TonB-dependent receptor plug domain-containing protein [Ferrimonas senticii]|uniref:TonB-dependent receptor plug domain-containing protein n=1 Tax=Ferrimonas senticii TaxID=394566 RepID=UPI00146BEFE6|nr:hypothetical protein [Ferrimonas senticii]
MKYSPIYAAVSALLAAPLLAQQAPVDLGNLEVVERVSADTSATVDAAYESYDPVDTGLSVINQTTISNSASGGIDTTELLKVNPFVQMDVNRDAVSAASIQTIRPSDFSISGGNYYDNNIMIDGVGANSVLDVAASKKVAEKLANPNATMGVNDIVGTTSQTVYVDPALVGSVEILDSNVSAEHGGFTGGVVNYNLREPSKEFGVNFRAGFQNDSMIDYIVSDEDQEDTEDTPPPSFMKYNTSLSLDLPLTEKLSVLASYSRSESSVDYQRKASVNGGEAFDNGDLSENFLVKGVYELNDNLTAEAQVVYSPYESAFHSNNSINAQYHSKTDGLSSYLKLNGYHGDLDWQTKVSYSLSDGSREAPSDLINWPSALVDWCSSGTCFEGGYGDLSQQQQTLGWSFIGSYPVLDGDLRFGVEVETISAEKSRPEQATSTSFAKCDASLNPDCVDGYLASTHIVYDAYDADASVNSEALWLEYQRQFGTLDVRIGARAEHDDYLDNYDIAPRFTASWQFYDQMFLTIGANRYYAGNNLSYAIAEQMGGYTRYSRKKVGGVYGDWTATVVNPDQYGRSELATPYSDELTAAITIPTALEGNFRLKGTIRDGRDGFASDEIDSNNDGKADTTVFTNDGRNEYYGISAEWTGNYQGHQFNANITWSESKSNGEYDTSLQDSPTKEYWYNGQALTEDEKTYEQGRQNFGSPLRASVSWSKAWLDDRLTTYLAANYRGAYEELDELDDAPLYEHEQYGPLEQLGVVERKAFTSFDFNSSIQVVRTDKHQATIDIKINNLLNDLPHTDTKSYNPYQQGRSYWVYFNYNY